MACSWSAARCLRPRRCRRGRPPGPAARLDVWITEVNRYGGSGPGNAYAVEQAAMLDRLADEMHAHPRIQAFIVYQLFDEAAVLDNYDEAGRPITGDEDEAWDGLVHCAGLLEVARRCGGALELKRWRALVSTAGAPLAWVSFAAAHTGTPSARAPGP